MPAIYEKTSSHVKKTMLSRAMTANQERCKPPLDDSVIESQMERALTFVESEREILD